MAWLAVVAVAVLSFPPPSPAGASFGGPNGRIVFSGYRDGETRIWTMNPDGTMPRRLTDNEYPILFIDPNLSPDGTRVVMGTHPVPEYPIKHVWTVRADGTGLTDLGVGSQPVWSPDGDRIAFSFGDDICLMDPDGSNRSCFEGGAFDSHPTWSPDGTRIAFQRVIQNHWDIVAMNVDGTGFVNITNDAFEDEAPDWSPDGTRIVFTRLAPDYHPDIWTIRIDGTDETNLTPDDEWDVWPDWSPDGSKILYRPVGLGGIFVMASDGSGSTRITNLVDDTPDWTTVAPIPIEQEPSSLTIEIGRAAGQRVSARGDLEPLHDGARLTATLLRRESGRFVRISKQRTGTTSAGWYYVSFSEPEQGRCKIVVRFPGDVDSLPTSASKRFPCQD